jgi:peptidyl-prolyl cis-trans isomerase SurA
MKMKKIKIIFVLMFVLSASISFAQKEGDRILAIIGNEIITESDFHYQVQLYARQNQLSDISPFLAQQIFQSMVTEKIIYAKAVQDSIIVTEDEINRELDSRIANLAAQLGSEQALTEVYGMSLARIRILLREDLEKRLKADKLKRRQFRGGVSISDREVREFFQTYRDSLPSVPDEYEISRIFIVRSVSEAEKQQARFEAQKILDSLRLGADFSDMARKYSHDSLSAIQGGDLGIARKGMFVPEFETAAFALNPGEISGLVETEYGVHIIKLNEKIGETIRTQHILITYPRLESSDFETISFLNDLKSKIEKGEVTFEDAASEFTQEQQGKNSGGYIGFVGADQLDESMITMLERLPDGTISEPVRIGPDQNYGYVIVKKISKSPAHELSLTQDYERIRSFALAFKENKELENWINEIREDIYVEIKI